MMKRHYRGIGFITVLLVLFERSVLNYFDLGRFSLTLFIT
jgi:hypothetical protein